MLYGLGLVDLVKLFAWLWVPAVLVVVAVVCADYQTWSNEAKANKEIARLKAERVRKEGL